MYDKPLFLPAGDQALVVELGDTINRDINRRVRDLTLATEKSNVPGVLEIVPTYRSLLVYYDPLAISFSDLASRIEQAENEMDEQALESPRIVRIPTLYGGEYGPDLEFVAEHAGLTIDEVVNIHSGTDYLVYMMGFSPGFPYLGGLSERLVTPRLKTPRVEIPAGSVGIAESQTGIYPVASPGGWQLIGRTPLKLFDAAREPPALINPSDYLRFVSIGTEGEYLDIQGLVENGEYDVAIEAAS